MRITCPFCGSRGVEEFSYNGAAGYKRPEPDAGEQAWQDYLYLRDNPSGLHRELWYHASGCRLWLEVTRDMKTHEITGVAAANGETV